MAVHQKNSYMNHLKKGHMVFKGAEELAPTECGYDDSLPVCIVIDFFDLEHK